MKCAHCGLVIMQCGRVGTWLIRRCSRSHCRDRHNGGWNLILRSGPIAISIALPGSEVSDSLESVIQLIETEDHGQRAN